MNLTSRRLRVLFSSLAAPTALAASACSEVDPPFSRSGFEAVACSPEGDLDWIGGLELAEPADGLIERVVGLPVDGFTDRTIGAPCSTASDVDACLASIASLTLLEGFDRTDWNDRVFRQVVATRGDAIEHVTDEAHFRELLGTIDTANEALLIALLDGKGHATCEVPNVRPAGRSFDVLVTSGSACGPGDHRYEHIVRVRADGSVDTIATRLVERANPNCAAGRRTDGTSFSVDAGGGVGDVLARMAALEAASVVSFLRLADEMIALGAPRELVERARRAAEDEARHVWLVDAQRLRFGGPAASVSIAPKRARTPLAVALENAREGMVRETYGALEATYRAEHAADPGLAAMFRAIALDETLHAALAIDFGRWLETTLEDDERVCVARARDEEVAALEQALVASDEDEGTRSALGSPSVAHARALMGGAFPTVWS